MNRPCCATGCSTNTVNSWRCRAWAASVRPAWRPGVAAPAAIAVGGLYALWIRLSERPLYDLELVKEKLTRPAALAELRLAVFAPATVAQAEVHARLEHL